MVVPFPEEEYLAAIGRLAYAVAYAEGAILFDLPQMDGLPPQLQLRELAGRSTGGIARKLLDEQLLGLVADVPLRDHLRATGRDLLEMATIRNAVLHARPAALEGRQRLNRWEPARREFFPVDEAHLRRVTDEVEVRVLDIADRRNALGFPRQRPT